jgi:hypothetical protein
MICPKTEFFTSGLANTSKVCTAIIKNTAKPLARSMDNSLLLGVESFIIAVILRVQNANADK